MISITTITGSYDGVIFNESADSAFKNYEPRLTKTKTLDGGTVIDHRGMITADREFPIKATNLTAAQVAALELIIKNETYINLSCDEGFFQGAIPRAEIKNGVLDMLFYVKE